MSEKLERAKLVVEEMHESKSQIKLKITKPISYQELVDIISNLGKFKDFDIIVEDTINLKN